MAAATVERATAAPTPEEKPFGRFGSVILDFARYRGVESVLEGPADTGKSRSCLEYVHGCCEKYAGCQWAIVRKTRSSITETAQKTYERWVRPDGASRLWHDLEYRYPNGSVIVLAGLDEPTRLLSSEFDGVYVMQAEEVSQDDWEMLTTRVTGRGAVMPYVRLIADMNPTTPTFHLYQREARGQVRFFQVRHADNPTITEQRLAPLRALTGYRLRRLFHGERVGAEGMYFEEWDPEVHVCRSFEPPAAWTRWLAVDYGFADPFCALFLARAPDTRRTVYVYRELYAPGLRDEDQARLIVKANGKNRLALAVLDPSMFNERREQEKPSIASVYAGVLRAGGVFDVGADQALPLYPASNARIPGWNAVRALLAHDSTELVKPRLQVMRERCPNLIRTLPAMVHDPLDPEDLADKIKGVKTEDHPVDTLRYAAMVEATAPRQGARAVRFGG